MLKDLSALAPTSFLALIAVVYMAIMMVIRFMDGSYLPGGEFHGFPRPKGHIGNFGIASLLLVNNLSIAFLCHYNGCKYYREFMDHRPGKFGVRVFTAFMLASCLFAITMLLGYATFGPNCEGVILNNYAKNDMLANIARFGMGFANVFSLPLMFSGLREATLVLLATANPGNDTLVGNDWVIAVEDETLPDPMFSNLLQKAQGQGQIGSVDEVTLHNSQVHICTRRRISFSAVHDWVSRQMSSRKRSAKSWTLQVPKDSPAQCAVEPMTDSQKPFLLKKVLMHATSPLRLRVDEELVMERALAEGTFGVVWQSTWQNTPVAAKFGFVMKQVARGAEILLSYGEAYELPQLPPPVFPAKVPRRKKTQKKTPDADDGVTAKKEDDAEAGETLSEWPGGGGVFRRRYLALGNHLLPFAAVIAILGIMVTDVSTVIGLVGAICGSAIIYVIPCLLFDRASAKFMGLGDYDHANPYDAQQRKKVSHGRMLPQGTCARANDWLHWRDTYVCWLYGEHFAVRCCQIVRKALAPKMRPSRHEMSRPCGLNLNPGAYRELRQQKLKGKGKGGKGKGKGKTKGKFLKKKKLKKQSEDLLLGMHQQV
eukprot:s1202_g6.t1